MRRLIVKVDDITGRAEELFLSLSHGIIASLVIAAVVFRYIFNDPLTWTEEFIIILFVWMLFIGFASGFQRRMHIRIDALLFVLPDRARALPGALAVAATLTTLCGLIWFGAAQSVSLIGTQTPMLGVSAAWLMAALPISCLLGTLHIVRFVLTDGLGETLWPRDIAGSNEGH
jgi:TRAP-type C4-dicarboxylate transport system permease small subunit